MTYDLLVRDALVVDGTGTPGRVADVAVVGERVVRVGEAGDVGARRVIDGTGLVLCPGFIDVHTHSDFTLPTHPRALSMTSQGVTTQLVGNCGFSPFPLGEDGGALLQEYSGFLDNGLPWGSWRTAGGFLDLLDALPLAGNVACQVGHGSVRIAVMGFEPDPPDEKQLEQMQLLVEDAMVAGAFGVSSGLTYAPSSAATTDELVAVAAVAGRFAGGFYSTHVRNEAITLVEAVQEALDIGRRAGVPVQLSHHKAMGSANWDKIATTLAMVESASAQGQDVTMDQYPYTAGSTGLAVILPRWALADGIARLQELLGDPGERRRIRKEIAAQRPEDLLAGLREFDPDAVVVADVPTAALEAYVGMTLREVATRRGQEPVDAALDLLHEAGGDVLTIVHGQSEANLRRILQHPLTMVASDGWTLSPDVEGRPHPRSYGTFSRVLGRYVRDEGVLPLEEAVRKMTSLPARRLRMADRGQIRQGWAADLVLLDAGRVRDRATFERPHTFSEGVRLVIVNGTVVVEDGVDTGAPAGRVLRRGEVAR